MDRLTGQIWNGGLSTKPNIKLRHCQSLPTLFYLTQTQRNQQNRFTRSQEIGSGGAPESLYAALIMSSHSAPSNNSDRKRRWLRFGVLIAIYCVLLIGGHWGGEWLIELVEMDISSAENANTRPMVMAAITLYSILLALPFVPGVEVSIALLLAFGSKVAMLIYLATILGLMIAYLVGWLVPIRSIASLFASLGMTRATSLVHRLEPLNADQRLEVLVENAPKRYLPVLLKYRYLSIAVALNIPGNAIIGGGGGIALLAGISGLFTFPRFLLTVAVAVLPIPLAILLMA